MARIPDDEIERIKQEISLVRLVEAQRLTLLPHGKDLKTHCPWHDDDGPSLIITPHKNLWHCMGACGEGGSVIDWVMKVNGISFRHAVELLKSEHPYAVAATNRPVKVGAVRKLDSPVDLDADDQALLNQVIGYYHETLKDSPEALQYLEKRGLTDPEVIDHFQLGFANRTLGLRIPQKAWKAGGEIRGRLQALGILRASGHEHFNGSLVIPVIDDGGNVREVYGRKINDHLRKGTPLHLYLPGPHRGVFNIQAVMAHEEVILCESLIDALTFWCAGYRNVTAAYGTGGFTDEIMAAFERYGTARVLIAYDRDEAGDRASARLSERLSAAGITTYRIQFPKGMDANGYACKVTPATQSLGVAIRSAVWLGPGGRPSESLAATGTGPTAPTGAEATVPPDDAPLRASSPLAAESGPMPVRQDPVVRHDVVVRQDVVASPVPPAPRPIDCEQAANEVILRFGDGPGGRRWRVRGLERNLSYDVLKVNVLVSRGDAFFVDTFDLYGARARTGFLKQAALELAVTEDALKQDLGRVLLKLEELQDRQIRAATEPADETSVTLDDAERAEALALLQAPDLLQQILTDFDACGVVGEETNKLVGYLAATSRLLDKPLAIVVQSNSAAGKSSLMDAVLDLMPPEAQIKSSMLTGQSLYYMGERELKHRILAIAEDEGIQRASFALKLLQSEGEVAITTVIKDPETGEHRTKTYKAEGPAMLMLTTTALEVDEELMNRCLVLTVDEDRAQTQAIHALQRHAQTLDGLLAQRDKHAIQRRHQNAQRLLRPLLVANPYARQLTFIDDRTRTRRDHMKYLTLIRAVALLHQYQREVKTIDHGGHPVTYIEATVEDIAVANRLAHRVLGRTLDELPPQTRRVLGEIVALVDGACTREGIERSAYRFTRRALREATGMSDSRLKLHLARLVDLEYLRIERADYGRFTYELLYDGDGGDAPHLIGLIDVAALQYDENRPGSELDRPAPGSGAARGWPGGGPASESAGKAHGAGDAAESDQQSAQIALWGPEIGESASQTEQPYASTFLAAKSR